MITADVLTLEVAHRGRVEEVAGRRSLRVQGAIRAAGAITPEMAIQTP